MYTLPNCDTYPVSAIHTLTFTPRGWGGGNYTPPPPEDKALWSWPYVPHQALFIDTIYTQDCIALGKRYYGKQRNETKAQKDLG